MDFENNHLTGRPLPRNNDDKELIIIGEITHFNNANETFTTAKDYQRWDLDAICEQAKVESKPPGIYLYNVAEKQFLAYTELNQEQLERTCRYFDIPVPEMKVSDKPTFREDAVVTRFEFF